MNKGYQDRDFLDPTGSVFRTLKVFFFSQINGSVSHMLA